MDIIRKIRAFVFAAILVAGVLMMPVRVNAAAVDSKAGVVATTAGRLNVRSSASTGSSVVTSLNKGSYVTLISRSGSWWKVEYAKDRYGYCHTDYIQTTSGSTAKVNVKSGYLNVRSGAGTNYGKIASLSKGETVIVLSTHGSWSRVLFHGTKTGYVSSQYLSGSAAYSAVSLSVPSMKQMDSRWATVEVAQSGKTMSQIGCATTAIAMMESYRKGITIFPDAMMNELRYTPSGSVYWPADYVTVTDGTAYLTNIYNLLKQGKPVLLGLKNSYGKQHWVVVTGFTGGNSLSASGFTINDPGSNSRTTLQQLLELHPIFYKYFHYN